jgi:glutaminase
MQSMIDRVHASVTAHAREGRFNGQTPMVSGGDAPRLGIAVQTLDGHSFVAGDSDTQFHLRNLSGLFTLTIALGRFGDAAWSRVGRDPPGNPYDPFKQLERDQGIPCNPFTNAGAMVITDVVLSGHRAREAIGEILRFVRFLADDEEIAIDAAESASANLRAKDAALANYMQAIGSFNHSRDAVLGVYAHQGAIAMSCRQLARAGVFLANDGAASTTGLQVISRKRARTICALMLTCGYDGGQADFGLRIGIPCKSGRGGGILGVVPGECSIAVWSPDLDANGNSILGSAALKEIAQTIGWSVFSRARIRDDRMADVMSR